MDVLAAFYPLQFVAEQVGGSLVSVESLTPPAADPHELELSMEKTRRISDADVVFFLSGFQPAVDEAIGVRAPELVLDARDFVPLMDAEGHGHSHEHPGEDEDHGEGGTDPHFWLDPTLLARLAGPVADALADVDPENAARYARRAQSLLERLVELDARFTEQLMDCDTRTVISSHAAFNYLTSRYGLEQVGIAGLDPESSPSPARLREVGRIASEHGVSTLFADARSSDKVTRTLASDLGLDVAVLDTLEGMSSADAAAGADYFTVMERNLDALVRGLGCRR